MAHAGAGGGRYDAWHQRSIRTNCLARQSWNLASRNDWCGDNRLPDVWDDRVSLPEQLAARRIAAAVERLSADIYRDQNWTGKEA